MSKIGEFVYNSWKKLVLYHKTTKFSGISEERVPYDRLSRTDGHHYLSRFVKK